MNAAQIQQTRALYAALAKLQIARESYDKSEITKSQLEAAENAVRAIREAMKAEAVEEAVMQ